MNQTGLRNVELHGRVTSLPTLAVRSIAASIKPHVISFHIFTDTMLMFPHGKALSTALWLSVSLSVAYIRVANSFSPLHLKHRKFKSYVAQEKMPKTPHLRRGR